MIIVLNPYSKNPKENFDKTFEYVKKLMNEGKEVFSPVIYGHYLAEKMGLKIDYKTWEFLNDFFQCATEFHVLCLPGWGKSEGLNKELKKIAPMGIPIKCFDNEFIEVE